MERTMQAIFGAGYERYASNHKVARHQRRAARSFIACRTAKLGGHVQKCENGHLEGVWYNSCKHRSCPRCNAIQSERWLQRQRASLLECPHRHLIFTVPHDLNRLWQLNSEPMMGLLFRAVRDTLMELLTDERHLGALAGFVLALHTWGRGLALHVHIHCLVTDGGLALDGTWREPRRRCLLPQKVVMILYRAKLRAALLAALGRGELRLPAGESERTLENALNRLGRSHWHVEVRDRYGHGVGVATYLARYVRGGPVQERRLRKVTPHEVVVRCKRYEGERRTVEKVRLGTDTFIARVLSHVPHPGRQVVRRYGLYANGNRARLDAARALFAQAPVAQVAFLDWQSYFTEVLGQPERGRCSRCGAPLERAAPIEPTHDPPTIH